MNLIDYVNKYGDLSFEEKEFNELDNLVFALLAYNNFQGIISTSRKNKLTIEEVSKLFFEKYTEDEIKVNILAIRNGSKLLELAATKDRYKNIEVYNYVYLGDENQQFSAMTFRITHDLVYVSFEGTDQLISGWEEDCMMAYKFPVLAQRHAINYLDKNFLFSNYKIMVGGHSKGGNLSLVGAMYCSPFVRNRIVKIYSNDGPGLRKKQIESKQYAKIENKLTHIIPNYSIVGLLLRNKANYKVVRSNKKGIFAHDGLTWQVIDDKFEEAELTRFSAILDEGIIKWLDKYEDDKREIFVDEIFKLFKKNNIDSLIDIMQNYTLIVSLLKESRHMDHCVAEMIKDLAKVLFECNKEYKTFINK